MIKYSIRRLLFAIPVLILISMISFILINAMPGDPLNMMIDPTSSAEGLEIRREALGLNQPIYIRYIKWVGEVLKGNLGYSMSNSRPVADIVGERILPTVSLMGISLLVSLAMAVPLGILTALKNNTFIDYLLSFITFLGISTPTFFVGLGAIYIISVRMDLLPTAMMQTPGVGFSVIDRIQHLILPVSVLAAHTVAVYTRYIRSSMLEELRKDYVRTARSKGMKEKKVIMGHVLRNSFIPVISLLGLEIPRLFAGAVVTEQIFVWPGIGRLIVESVGMRDYPILMAIIMITALLVLISNLITDIGYAIVDPRIAFD